MGVAAPAGAIPADQPQAVIGIPVAVGDPAVDEPHPARESGAGETVPVGPLHEGADLRREGGGNLLVGVEAERPRLRGEVEGRVLRVAESQPGHRVDARPGLAGHCRALVRGLVERHDDLHCPPLHACEAAGQVRGLVAGDNDHRERKGRRWHGIGFFRRLGPGSTRLFHEGILVESPGRPPRRDRAAWYTYPQDRQARTRDFLPAPGLTGKLTAARRRKPSAWMRLTGRRVSRYAAACGRPGPVDDPGTGGVEGVAGGVAERRAAGRHLVADGGGGGEPDRPSGGADAPDHLGVAAREEIARRAVEFRRGRGRPWRRQTCERPGWRPWATGRRLSARRRGGRPAGSASPPARPEGRRETRESPRLPPPRSVPRGRRRRGRASAGSNPTPRGCRRRRKGRSRRRPPRSPGCARGRGPGGSPG